jgi:hypothetical protein
VNGCSSRSRAGCDADPTGDVRGEDVPDREEPFGLSGELRGRGEDGGDPRGCARDGSVEREMGDAATTRGFSADGSEALIVVKSSSEPQRATGDEEETIAAVDGE